MLVGLLVTLSTETHKEMREDVDRLQAMKEEKIRAAERLYELQLECLKNVFDAEKKQAADDFEVRSFPGASPLRAS